MGEIHYELSTAHEKYRRDTISKNITWKYFKGGL